MASDLSGRSATTTDKPAALYRPAATILSPLRYPGAKRRLAEFVRQALLINSIQPQLFIEPFAGGASVALQLLNDGVVDSIGLADADPLVAAFWHTVFFDGDWLLKQVESIEVTLDQWNKFKHSLPLTRRDRALTCLFLNRTSFSGILAPNAGPIGGQSQTSAYKIDCRFPRETLARRLKQAQALAPKVRFIWNLPWRASLSRVSTMASRGRLPVPPVYYFDPPFIRKSARLYTKNFQADDHVSLRDAVASLDVPWILSYDFAPEVFALYPPANRAGTWVNVLYSGSARNGRRSASEAIISNLPRLPGAARLWRTSHEWHDNDSKGAQDAAAG